MPFSLPSLGSFKCPIKGSSEEAPYDNFMKFWWGDWFKVKPISKWVPPLGNGFQRGKKGRTLLLQDRSGLQSFIFFPKIDGGMRIGLPHFIEVKVNSINLFFGAPKNPGKRRYSCIFLWWDWSVLPLANGVCFENI